MMLHPDHPAKYFPHLMHLINNQFRQTQYNDKVIKLLGRFTRTTPAAVKAAFSEQSKPYIKSDIILEGCAAHDGKDPDSIILHDPYVLAYENSKGKSEILGRLLYRITLHELVHYLNFKKLGRHAKKIAINRRLCGQQVTGLIDAGAQFEVAAFGCIACRTWHKEADKEVERYNP